MSDGWALGRRDGKIAMKVMAMAIVIKALDRQNIQDAYRCDGSFIVDSELVLFAENGVIRYEIAPLPAHEKRYVPIERNDLSASIMDDPRKAAFLAYLDGRIAGRLVMSVNWNRYGLLEDIEVDVGCRRRGVGQALIEQAVAWTKARGLPGIMLETQNNNVSACKFYERCGFLLGGFDRYLYRGLNPEAAEIALYWYRPLRPDAPPQS